MAPAKLVIEPSVFVAEKPRKESPESYVLAQNFPNPFNAGTVIEFSLATASPVQLTVHDLLGKKVATLVNEVKQAGPCQIRFDAAGLASGVYVYTLQTNEGVETKKMLLLR